MASEDAKRRLYDVLGVPSSATDEDIKAAYRQKARDNHPDLNPGDEAAASRMKEINEAGDVLTDPGRRRLYDETGDSASDAGRQKEADREQAIAYINGQLSALIDKPELDPMADLLDVLRRVVGAAMAQERSTRASQQKKAQRARALAKRSRARTPDGDNLLPAMFEEYARCSDEQVRMHDRRLSQYEIALSILNDHSILGDWGSPTYSCVTHSLVSPSSREDTLKIKGVRGP